jgi:carboxypeptidase family protein/TonB-dependent receptor-like protein
MRPRVCIAVVVLLLCAAASAFAQGAGNVRSSIGGTVTDTSGGVIPGATVVIRNLDTSVKTELVTTSAGTFVAPAIDPGNYEITVSLAGFKTSVTKDVKVVPSIPFNLVIKIEVGNLTETVNVSAKSALVNTSTPTVTNTLVSADLVNLPLLTHNALYALTLLPGVDQTAANPRSNTTIAGLPASSISITIDGVNTNNNQDRNGDGFYSMVFPHLDAIEQVSLTTANSDAAGASQGAVQVKFVTRSGSNQYKGTAYNYYRDERLNSNYIFNIFNGLPKNAISANQFGASQGGPIVIPRLVDGHGRAFFFFNMEEFHQPIAPTRTRTLLSEAAMSGIYQYQTTVNGVVTVNQINLLALATANGQTNTIDPTIGALLGQINTGANSTGKITASTNPNLRSYVYQPNGNYVQHLPTSKVDFVLTPKHRLSGSYLWQINNRLPDIQNSTEPPFPGLTAGARYTSKRTVGSVSLRSTLGGHLVNELVGGWQWSPGCFQCDLSPSMFENQGGFNLGFPLGATSATNTGTREAPRNTPNWNIDDNLTWIRGAHSVSMGVSFSDYFYLQKQNTAVPSISFGIQTGLDPADAMFTAANGVPTSETNNARALYAFLTGRVTQIGATGRLDSNGHYQYPPQQGVTNDFQLKEWGTYIQDTWRMTPTVTLNAGLRWEIQLPLEANVPNYQTATLADACGVSGLATGSPIQGAPSFINQCNIFKPGVLTGSAPHYTPFKPHSHAYPIAWGNLAPNVGVAWRPNVQDGILRKILGDPEQATIRGGYSIAYDRNGFGDLAGVFTGNGGATTGANRNQTNGNLTTTWPLLFRNRELLGPPAKCAEGANPAPVNCMAFSPLLGLAVNQTSINIFDPNIKIAYATSFSAGIQRPLNRSMVVEIQYIGTRRHDGWDSNNWNEVNIVENGFLDEFKLAQQNLIANQAAGNGATFAFTGAPGTRPLPIFLASYLGLASSQASDPSKYTGTNWTNTTVISALSYTQPNVTTLSSNGTTGLYGNTTFRANGRAAGLPINFWVMNPDATSVNVTSNALRSRYDSLQLNFRSRLSHGMTLQASYTISKSWGSTLDSTGINPGALHRDYVFIPSTSGIPKSFKFQTTYEIPIGRGKTFGSNLNPLLNGVIGNWSFGMTGQVRSGRVFNLSQAKLVGMTKEEFQKEFYIRVDPVTHIVTTMDPAIILNTRRAYTIDGSLGAPTGRYVAPAATAGCINLYPADCGEPRRIDLTGPVFANFDMNLKKTFPIPGSKANFQFEVSAVNVFNLKNYNAVLAASTSSTLNQVTSAYNDIGNTFNPGGRVGQLIVRVNW